MTKTGVENPARINQYLNAVESTCFTCGSDLAQSGGAYLFLRYLYEQAESGHLMGANDGADLIANLVGNVQVGIGNIVDSALASNKADRFNELLGDFSKAVYLSDFSGISFLEKQNDNRNTLLKGPHTLVGDQIPFNTSFAARGISYIEVTGEEILKEDSTLKILFFREVDGRVWKVELLYFLNLRLYVMDTPAITN